MALVTIEELTKFTEFSLNNRQEVAAQLILDGLQSEMETYLRRPVEVTAFVEDIHVPWDQGGAPSHGFFSNNSIDSSFPGATQSWADWIGTSYPLYLQNTPVVSITGVTWETPTVAATALTEGTHYSRSAYGLDLFGGSANTLLKVTYTGGLDGPSIPTFKILMLRAAAREMRNLHDDTVSTKNLEVQNVALETTGFLDSELMTLKRWKRVRI